MKNIISKLNSNGFKNIHSIYRDGNTYHIIFFIGGKIFIALNALSDEDCTLTGPYPYIKTAIEQMGHYKCVWKKNEEKEEVDYNLLYRAFFKLTAPVTDFKDAYDYLQEDDMTRYLKRDTSLMDSTKDKVKSITWILNDVDCGWIDVRTKNYLIMKESEELSNWIAGQNSDGLGEGFEQQDFAYHFDGDEDSELSFEEGEWIVSSFKSNDCKLYLIETTEM